MEKSTNRIKEKKISLRETVKDTLRHYFSNVDPDQPVDFYWILLEEVERPILEVMAKHANYNQVKMSKMMGISRGTLRKKLKQYGMLEIINK